MLDLGWCLLQQLVMCALNSVQTSELPAAQLGWCCHHPLTDLIPADPPSGAAYYMSANTDGVRCSFSGAVCFCSWGCVLGTVNRFQSCARHNLGDYPQPPPLTPMTPTYWGLRMAYESEYG